MTVCTHKYTHIHTQNLIFIGVTLHLTSSTSSLQPADEVVLSTNHIVLSSYVQLRFAKINKALFGSSANWMCTNIDKRLNIFFPAMIAVPLVRRRSLIETLWVDSGAPEARPVFPASSLFSLLASVNMAAQLSSALYAPHRTALLLISLRITQTALNKPNWNHKGEQSKRKKRYTYITVFKVNKLENQKRLL